MIERADAKLTPQVRSGWRWRLFRIRAAIDQEMYRNTQGQGREQVFRQAYEELMKISRADRAMPMMRPAPIPALDEPPGRLIDFIHDIQQLGSAVQTHSGSQSTSARGRQMDPRSPWRESLRCQGNLQ